MKFFLFYFEMAIKITGWAQNYRVGRVSGNTPIFLGLRSAACTHCHFYIYMLSAVPVHCLSFPIT